MFEKVFQNTFCGIYSREIMIDKRRDLIWIINLNILIMCLN